MPSSGEPKMAALFRERALRFVRGLTVAAWVRKQPRDQPYHLVSPIPVRVSGRNETCIPGASARPFKHVASTRIRHWPKARCGNEVIATDFNPTPDNATTAPYP